MKKGIQIQMILYNNTIKEIEKTIISISNAVRVYQNNESEKGFAFSVVCGDSSKKKSLCCDDSLWIKKELGNEIDFEYKFFDFNSGYGKGHNILAKDCDVEYMLIINPDVILSPRFFVEMLEPFKDEKTGMVEARQTPVEHQKEYDIDTMETEWATGACILVKTDIFHQLDGFDSEHFFMYCEDVDFSWRLRLLGYKIIYQPLAPVFHSKRLSDTGHWMPTDTEIYYSAVSSLMMAYKWSGDNEFNRLKEGYRNSEIELHRKAIEYFDSLEEKDLPEKLDKEHKIAKFLNGYYTENRYIL